MVGWISSLSVARLLAFVTLLGACASQPVRPTRAVPETVTLYRNHPTLRASPAFSEQLFFYGRFDGGGSLYGRFLTTNLAGASGQASVKLVISLPGTRFQVSARLKEGDWRVAATGIDVRWKKGKILLNGGQGRIQCDSPKGRVDITFRWRSKPLRPKSGNLYVGRGRHIHTVLLVPRGEMRLTLHQKGDSAPRRAEGVIFVEQRATNIAPFDFARSFVQLRSFQPTGTLVFGGFGMLERYGGGFNAWLLWAPKQGKPVLYSPVTVRVASTYSHRESGYVIPTSLIIQPPGTRMALAIKTPPPTKHINDLKRLSTAERLVVSMLMKPWTFRSHGRYRFLGPGLRIDGAAHVTFQQIQR